jgi:hypothetical protein
LRKTILLLAQALRHGVKAHSGLLHIRSRGWDNRAADCAVEADHLHNIPELVRKPDLRRLSYYYDISRTCFVKEAKGSTEGFEKSWARLGELLAEIQSKGSGGDKTPAS